MKILQIHRIMISERYGRQQVSSKDILMRRYTTLGNLVSQNKYCLRKSKLNIDMSVVVISSFFMAMKFLGDAV